jgi:hypothetical protein
LRLGIASVARFWPGGQFPQVDDRSDGVGQHGFRRTKPVAGLGFDTVAEPCRLDPDEALTTGTGP